METEQRNQKIRLKYKALKDEIGAKRARKELSLLNWGSEQDPYYLGEATICAILYKKKKKKRLDYSRNNHDIVYVHKHK